MQTITTVGLDIAKSVFQVYGVDTAGQVVIRRQLKRRMSLRSFKSCRPAWLASKPAHRHTICHANCRRSACSTSPMSS